MGAYPNRSAKHADRQRSRRAHRGSGFAIRTELQTDAGPSDDSANGIEPIAMRVPDACRYIGIGRSTLYVLIAEGEVEIVKLGCSTLVLTESLKALIAKRRGHATISSDQHTK